MADQTTNPKDEAARLRDALPEGYEILPIAVIEVLVAAAYAAYEPAILCTDYSMDDVENAGRAANNVLARHNARHRKEAGHAE